MNPVLELMTAHASVRRFEDRAVPEELVRQAVQSAQCAATSHMVQAYCLLRVRDTAKRARLAALAGGQAHVESAPVFFAVCGDQRRHRLIAARRGNAYAPNFETFLLCAFDAALYAQNLALAFESLGLGICYIGGLRNDLPAVDAVLEPPPDVFPFFGMCAGWPAETPPRRPRLPLDAVLHDERFPSEAQLVQSIDAYDAELGRWYAERGKSGYDWSGGIARLFSRPAREQLYGYYSGKGARLS